MLMKIIHTSVIGEREVVVRDEGLDGCIGFAFEAVGGGPDVFFDVMEVGDGEGEV
jgi:hypothetical protein